MPFQLPRLLSSQIDLNCGEAAAMNFALSDEQRALQQTARRFAREQVIPVAQSMETTDFHVTKRG